MPGNVPPNKPAASMNPAEATPLQLEYITKANQILEAVGLHWDFGDHLRAEIRNLSDWVSYNDIFVECEYDTPLHRALHSGESSVCIFDLGANIGLFTLRAMVLRARISAPPAITIHAIEAHPDIFSRLEKGLRPLSTEDAQLHSHYGLIGQKHGEGSFTNYPFSGWNTSLPPQNSAIEENATRLTVPYYDLDPLFEAHESIHLLKINAEGAEQSFFESYRQHLSKVKEIALVVHPQKCDSDACFSILKEAGFSTIERISKNRVYSARR